jgi:hypothetical protein
VELPSAFDEDTCNVTKSSNVNSRDGELSDYVNKSECLLPGRQTREKPDRRSMVISPVSPSHAIQTIPMLADDLDREPTKQMEKGERSNSKV